MSAYFVYPYSDRIEMLVDGAVMENGLLAATVDKVRAVPGMPVAVTGRGGRAAVEWVEDSIAEAFHDAGGVNDGLRALAKALPIHPANLATDYFEIVIACISETDGPEIWYYNTARTHGPFGLDTVPPQTLYSWQGVAAGGSGMSAEQMSQIGLSGASLATGLLPMAMPIMDTWRRTPAKPWYKPDASEYFAIGGHVDHAVIDASGVRISRLHTWPDEVGKPIQP